jgi:hypothetical protein
MFRSHPQTECRPTSLEAAVRLSAVARVALLLLSPGAATIAHAQTPDTTRITATRLAEGIYVLMGQGGNIGLSTGPNGAFLVDDEYTGGNENLGKAGVLIVAHENTRKRMSVEQFIAAFDAHSRRPRQGRCRSSRLPIRSRFISTAMTSGPTTSRRRTPTAT